MTKLYTAYADVSCSPDSLVMTAPLDILGRAFGLGEAATDRIETETADGGICDVHGNYRPMLGFSVLFVKETNS